VFESRLGHRFFTHYIYFVRSLEVKIRAVGREHVIVAMAYMNLGTLEQCRKNTAKALEYSYQAREIHEVCRLMYSLMENMFWALVYSNFF